MAGSGVWPWTTEQALLVSVSICQFDKDSAGLLSRDGITFFRCSRSSDGDVCAEREPTVKVLKGRSLLNKGGP